MEIIVLKVGLTFLLALAFGLYRQFSNKPIGFGTFIFVSVGACTLAVIANHLNADNPLPLMGAIVTGIGFLGAGALIKTSDKIYGFTSAASIWLFAVLGLTVGIGKYILAANIYVIIWIVVFIDLVFQRKSLGLYRKKLILSMKKPFSKSEIKEIIGAKKYKTLEISYDKKNSIYTFVLLIDDNKNYLDKLPGSLLGHEDLVDFKLI